MGNGLINTASDCAVALAALADEMRRVSGGMAWVAMYADDVAKDMRDALREHSLKMQGAAAMAEKWANAIVSA